MREERTDSGQMHTLEGLSAAMIVVIAAFYASQAIAIGPTSSSTASKAAEGELKQVGEDVLAQAYSNGDLRKALLDWNDNQNQFVNATTARYYTGQPPDNGFGTTLNRTFDERGVAYNINLHYLPVSKRLYNESNNATIENTPKTRYLVNGEPTDNAVVASQMIVLRHEDEIENPADTPLNETAVYPISGFVNETEPTTTLYRKHMYNLVEVRMILWRT